jgi:hypothetical protein
MLDDLRREQFIPYLNSQFQVGTGAEPITLELTEVSELRSSRHNEAFSLVFRGRNDQYLPQAMYRFQHSQLGEFDLFIVPIGQDPQGFYYEALFNRLRRDEAG